MKKILESISYIAAFIMGMYGLRLLDGKVDLFSVIGFVVCAVLVFVCKVKVKKG